MPLMLAIIGGDPNRFRPYVDLYLQALSQLGKQALPIGVHSHGYVSNSDEQARDELWPDYKVMRDRRRRTRLAADAAGRVRPRDRTWIAVCRIAGNGIAEDRRYREGARSFQIRYEIQRGSVVPRTDHALYFAVWRKKSFLVCVKYWPHEAMPATQQAGLCPRKATSRAKRRLR